MIGEFKPSVEPPVEPVESPEGYNLKRKPIDELKRRLDEAEGFLNADKNPDDLKRELAPKSENGNLYNLSLDEIKAKYPERYAIYLQLLRRQINEQPDNESKLKTLEEMRGSIQVLNNLDDYILKHKDKDNGEEKILREYQATVFEDLRNFVEQGGKKGYIKLPTGVGKTVLFIEFIKALNLRTMIVVPTQVLIKQTEEKIQQFAPQMETGSVWAGKKEYNKNVTIITYDSLVSGVKSGIINPQDYQCLILDEVHKSLSEQRREAVDKFENILTVGFTATPEYSEDKKVDKLLETEIHSLEIKEATEQRLLSPFRCAVVKTKTDTSKVEILSNGEYDQKELEKAINIQSRNQVAVSIYEQRFKDQSAIAFCLTIKHAEDVAKEFMVKGISAVVITGKQTQTEQDEIIRKFKTGEIKVLLTVDLLAEGFDAQNATVCFNLAPTHSVVRAGQRAGRVLRLDDNNSDKEAFVVDFLDEYREENLSDSSKDKKNPPIMFSEIVGASAVYPKASLDAQKTKDKLLIREDKDNIIINGVEVVFDVEEVLAITNKMKEDREKMFEIPEGWKNTAQLAEELKVSIYILYRYIRKIIPTITEEDSLEWFRERGKTTYYSPKLIEKIRQYLEAPEGWKGADQLAEEFKVSINTMYRYVKKIIPTITEEDSLEWFRECGAATYYSPKLIEKIRQYLEAPEGWKNTTQLAKDFKVGWGAINVYIRKIIPTITEEDSLGWLRKCGAATYCSPKLIEKIRQYLEVPEGWKSATQLAMEFGTSRGTINVYIRKIIPTISKEDSLELLRKYDKTTYCSPKLIEKIRQYLEVPEGWKNITQLAKDFKVGWGVIDVYIRKIIPTITGEDSSEWFIKRSKTFYYSPEFIEELKKYIKRK